MISFCTFFEMITRSLLWSHVRPDSKPVSLTISITFLRRTKELSQWSVVLGQTYVTSSGAVSVESILINHAYSSVSHDYDIAVVRLATDVLPAGAASIISSLFCQ